jgi:hypothetical protein
MKFKRSDVLTNSWKFSKSIMKFKRSDVVKDYPLLISLHKSGSTWVFSYIHKHYRKRGITMPPNNFYSEFFCNHTSELDFTHKINPLQKEFIKRSSEERFALLELLRKFGLELAHKAHVPEIIDIWPRFKEFYKDYDILVLKRRHIFSHYLHMLFFYCVQQAVGPHFLKGKEEEGYTHIVPSKIHHGRSEDILKSTILEYNVQFKHHDKYLKKFTRNIRFLNDVVIEELDRPEVIFTEDITTQWLRDRFNESVDLKKTVEPFKTLDFASYFKPEELKIVHDKLYERFDNEFKYMGYRWEIDFQA